MAVNESFDDYFYLTALRPKWQSTSRLTITFIWQTWDPNGSQRVVWRIFLFDRLDK